MSEVRNITLNPAAATLAEHARNTWAVTVDPKTVRAEIESPSFWSHIAHRLKAKDHIEVYSADGSFYAEYMVLSSDRTWAKVVALSWIDLTTIKSEVSDEVMKSYTVKWRGPKRWSVLRNADNAVLHEGVHSEEDAHKWLEIHLKTLGIAA